MDSKKKDIVFLGILFVIAFLVRLPGIQFHSLWFDETSTAHAVSQTSFGDVFKMLFTFEGTPPLFFLLVRSFIHTLHLPINEYNLRFLPLLSGALSCVLCFLLFRQLSNRRTALLIFVLVTLSSFQISLSLEARCYSLLGLFTLIILLLVIEWWKKTSKMRTVVLFVSIVVFTQIHYYSVFVMAAIFLSVFLTERKDKKMLHFALINAAAFLVTSALLFPLFLNQVSNEIGDIRSSLTSQWLTGVFYAPVKVILGAYLFKIHSIKEITYADLAGILPAMAVLCLTVILSAMRWKKQSVSKTEKVVSLAVLFTFIFHIIVGWKIPSVHPRYMAHFLVLLFGIVLVVTADRKKLQAIIFIVLLSLNVIGTIKYFTYSKAYIEPWKEIASAVERHMEGGSGDSEPVITDLMICYTIAFYAGKKTIQFYQYSFFNDTIPYAHVHLFGHELYSSLFHYTYYPLTGYRSNLDLMREKKKGIFINKMQSGHTKTAQLYKDSKGLVDFTLLQYFKTNQGDVCIYRWNYKGKG